MLIEVQGRGGPSVSYEKRKRAAEQLQAQAKAAGVTSRRAAGQAERVSGDLVCFVTKLN